MGFANRCPLERFTNPVSLSGKVLAAVTGMDGVRRAAGGLGTAAPATQQSEAVAARKKSHRRRHLCCGQKGEQGRLPGDEGGRKVARGRPSVPAA